MSIEDIKTLVEVQIRDEIFQPKIDEIESGRFVEVGTFIGGNACRIADKIRKSGKDIKLFAVDNFKFDNISGASFNQAGVSPTEDFYERFLDNVYSNGLEKIIIDVRGDSIEVSNQFGDESIDLLFLDGTHGYEYCRDEIIAWLPRVKVGGIISGHDWPEACIKRAVSDTLSGYKINVTSTNGAYWTIKC